MKSTKKNDKIVQFKHVIIDVKGPENPHIKCVGDINGNGFVDVVAASSNGGPIVWYEYPNWTKSGGDKLLRRQALITFVSLILMVMVM